MTMFPEYTKAEQIEMHEDEVNFHDRKVESDKEYSSNRHVSVKDQVSSILEIWPWMNPGNVIEVAEHQSLQNGAETFGVGVFPYAFERIYGKYVEEGTEDVLKRMLGKSGNANDPCLKAFHNDLLQALVKKRKLVFLSNNVAVPRLEINRLEYGLYGYKVNSKFKGDLYVLPMQRGLKYRGYSPNACFKEINPPNLVGINKLCEGYCKKTCVPRNEQKKAKEFPLNPFEAGLMHYLNPDLLKDDEALWTLCSGRDFFYTEPSVNCPEELVLIGHPAYVHIKGRLSFVVKAHRYELKEFGIPTFFLQDDLC